MKVKSKPVRALTVKQPWASLIASGIKQVENRSYPVPKTVRGQRVAIHAGKGFDSKYLHRIQSLCTCRFGRSSCDKCGWRHFFQNHGEASQQVAGRILCTARIVGQVHIGGVEPFINICPYCIGTGSLPSDDINEWSHDEANCVDCRGAGTTKELVFDSSFYENLPGVYGWILADVELVDDPRIHRGMLGFWEVPK